MATTLSTNLTQIIEIKNNIKEALINRGIDMENRKFDEYPTAITEIPDESATVATLRQQLATANATIQTLTTENESLQQEITDAEAQTSTILS